MIAPSITARSSACVVRWASSISRRAWALSCLASRAWRAGAAAAVRVGQGRSDHEDHLLDGQKEIHGLQGLHHSRRQAPIQIINEDDNSIDSLEPTDELGEVAAEAHQRSRLLRSQLKCLSSSVGFHAIVTAPFAIA